MFVGFSISLILFNMGAMMFAYGTRETDCTCCRQCLALISCVCTCVCWLYRLAPVYKLMRFHVVDRTTT